MEKIKLLLSVGDDSVNYVEAISGLGAEPTAQYLPAVDISYDGLILCGGRDLHPSCYGEEIDGSVNMDIDRDEAEFALMQAYMDAGKPILGICRGHQLINVYFGGSLHQDIADAIAHKRQNGCDIIHAVTAEPDSVLGKLYGETFTTNSIHH